MAFVGGSVAGLKRGRAPPGLVRDGVRMCAEKEVSRRELLHLGALVSSIGLVPRVAIANVNVDIDKYGDKEMKVSAINRLKQNLRNQLGQDPMLIPAFAVLPVMDALSYDAAKATGGPDGSIIFEMDRPENAALANAFAAVQAVKERQKELSYADIFAFCGAVAVEVTGGPRIKVQIGREDAEERDTSGIYNSLTASTDFATLKAALQRSGRKAARDAVLLHCALQAMTDIATKQNAVLLAKKEEEDPYAESLFGDGGDLTYGAVTKKGKSAILVDSTVSSLKIKGSKFDSSYIKALLQAQKSSPDSLSTYDKAVLADPECQPWITKYAENNRAFVNDYGDCFESLTLLGSKFEQAKIRDE